MVHIDLPIVPIFGGACMFWGAILLLCAALDGDSFVAEGKARWKAVALGLGFLAFGALCFRAWLA